MIERTRTIQRKHKKSIVFLSLSVLCIIFISLFSLCIGTMDISFRKVIGACFLFFQLDSPWEVTNAEYITIIHLRMPRIILSLLCGSSFAAAGAAIQGLFRNPLAAPGLLGINAGSGLAASIIIVLGNKLLPESLLNIQPYILPFAAFGGAIVVTQFVFTIGSKNGRTDISIVLLAGIAVNAICAACLGYLIYLADVTQLRSLTFWNLGSLSTGTWKNIFILTPIVIISFIMLNRTAKSLNTLLLGESEALYMGVNIQSLKKIIIIASALTVGSCVSVVGGIGFIGLVAPHIVRQIIGSDNRYLIPASALTGMILLSTADILSKTLISQAELPVGIITATIGAPVFLMLLLKRRKNL